MFKMRFTVFAKTSSPLFGIALAFGAYSLFAIQDAIVKWLVAEFAVPQILFTRSIVIVALSSAFAKRDEQSSITRVLCRKSIILRAAFMLSSWVAFYSSAKYLGLAEMTTLSFSAPPIVVILSIFFLKEKVGVVRWIACIVGFGGVAIAANLTHAPNLIPAALVLFAGFCWACNAVLIKRATGSESTLNQILATNALFVFVFGATLPWFWTSPDVAGWVLMVSLGFIAAIGQYLLYEGFRHAQASTIAPIEYTCLVWASLLGYLIWGEVPTNNVFIGAFIIIGTSLVLVAWERRLLILARRRLTA